jgi:hypothetical protein
MRHALFICYEIFVSLASTGCCKLFPKTEAKVDDARVVKKDHLARDVYDRAIHYASRTNIVSFFSSVVRPNSKVAIHVAKFCLKVPTRAKHSCTI